MVAADVDMAEGGDKLFYKMKSLVNYETFFVWGTVKF